MILYTVNISVDLSIAEEWQQYMLETHIPEVMAAGFFEGYRFRRFLKDGNGGLPAGEALYRIEYTCRSMERLEAYQAEAAPALQKDHTDRYEGRAIAYREILQEIEGT